MDVCHIYMVLKWFFITSSVFTWIFLRLILCIPMRLCNSTSWSIPIAATQLERY